MLISLPREYFHWHEQVFINILFWPIWRLRQNVTWRHFARHRAENICSILQSRTDHDWMSMQRPSKIGWWSWPCHLCDRHQGGRLFACLFFFGWYQSERRLVVGSVDASQFNDLVDHPMDQFKDLSLSRVILPAGASWFDEWVIIQWITFYWGKKGCVMFLECSWFGNSIKRFVWQLSRSTDEGISSRVLLCFTIKITKSVRRSWCHKLNAWLWVKGCW